MRRLLAVKAGEQVALVCDPHSEMSMVYALAGVTESLGAEYTILVMPTRSIARKNDLTPPIERALEAADCLIGLTGSCGAPTYSRAVKHLLDEKRLRAISMVMRSLDNYTEGGALADGARLAATDVVREWRDPTMQETYAHYRKKWSDLPGMTITITPC